MLQANVYFVTCQRTPWHCIFFHFCILLPRLRTKTAFRVNHLNEHRQHRRPPDDRAQWDLITKRMKRSKLIESEEKTSITINLVQISRKCTSGWCSGWVGVCSGDSAANVAQINRPNVVEPPPQKASSGRIMGKQILHWAILEYLSDFSFICLFLAETKTWTSSLTFSHWSRWIRHCRHPDWTESLSTVDSHQLTTIDQKAPLLLDTFKGDEDKEEKRGGVERDESDLGENGEMQL